MDGSSALSVALLINIPMIIIIFNVDFFISIRFFLKKNPSVFIIFQSKSKIR